jgi:hypothetical protein
MSSLRQIRPPATESGSAALLDYYGRAEKINRIVCLFKYKYKMTFFCLRCFGGILGEWRGGCGGNGTVLFHIYGIYIQYCGSVN